MQLRNSVKSTRQLNRTIDLDLCIFFFHASTLLYRQLTSRTVDFVAEGLRRTTVSTRDGTCLGQSDKMTAGTTEIADKMTLNYIVQCIGYIDRIHCKLHEK